MAADEEISVVEGCGGDANEELARPWRRLGNLFDLDAIMKENNESLISWNGAIEWVDEERG